MGDSRLAVGLLERAGARPTIAFRRGKAGVQYHTACHIVDGPLDELKSKRLKSRLVRMFNSYENGIHQRENKTPPGIQTPSSTCHCPVG